MPPKGSAEWRLVKVDINYKTTNAKIYGNFVSKSTARIECISPVDGVVASADFSFAASSKISFEEAWKTSLANLDNMLHNGGMATIIDI
jgi:hypothetical protein